MLLGRVRLLCEVESRLDEVFRLLISVSCLTLERVAVRDFRDALAEDTMNVRDRGVLRDQRHALLILGASLSVQRAPPLRAAWPAGVSCAAAVRSSTRRVRSSRTQNVEFGFRNQKIVVRGGINIVHDIASVNCARSGKDEVHLGPSLSHVVRMRPARGIGLVRRTPSVRRRNSEFERQRREAVGSRVPHRGGAFHMDYRADDFSVLRRGVQTRLCIAAQVDMIMLRSPSVEHSHFVQGKVIDRVPVSHVREVARNHENQADENGDAEAADAGPADIRG